MRLALKKSALQNEFQQLPDVRRVQFQCIVLLFRRRLPRPGGQRLRELQFPKIEHHAPVGCAISSRAGWWSARSHTRARHGSTFSDFASAGISATSSTRADFPSNWKLP